jgi:glycosyltransferase involved in cell wall biosynthesis
MRILWLSGYSPWPADHGGKIRLYNLVRQMVARGHTVSLWCVTNEKVDWPEAPPPSLSLRCFAARSRDSASNKLEALISPLPEPVWSTDTTEVEAAIAAVESDPPDVIVLTQALVGSLARSVPPSIPFVLDAHNVEWWLAEQIARSQFRVATRTRFSVDARKFARLEAELMRTAAAVIAVSAEDAARLRRLSADVPIAVHRSGVDLDYFSWVDHADVRGNRLLMTGTLGYAPNLDACQWMRAEIMPAIRTLIDARLDLVGGAADSALELHAPDEGIYVAGPVPDVRPFMERADVFLAPLRMGSGTRLKVIEAMAAGVPVVATDVAVEGLELPQGLVLVGNDVDAIAEHVRVLLTDLPLRRRMSLAGRRHVEKHFSWATIAAGVEETLVAVASARGAKSRAVDG